MKRATVIRASEPTEPEWQALFVGRGPLDSAMRLARVFKVALEEHGHDVTMARMDEVKPKAPRAIRKPS